MINHYIKRCWGTMMLAFLPIFLFSQVALPVASVSGGKFTQAFTVSLSTTTAGAYIRYSLDGNEPDSLTSPQYSAPLTIDKTTTFRAKAFATGLISSKIMTHTYFFNVSHTFPIVAVSFKPADFFDPLKGIYPNFENNLEVPIHVEFFEPNKNTPEFSIDCGTEIQGSASAVLPQKSLELKAKAVYGSANIPYAMFSDLPYPNYKRLVLRNGGQDWNITMFRDELVTSLFTNTSDLNVGLQKPALYGSAQRPCVVYYNGEYWGVHNIRERMKTPFVEQRFNLKSSEYDMVENETETLNGDSTVWLTFQNSLNNGTNYSDNAAFDLVKQKIDIQNFIDYNAFNVYIDNEDWPANNNRRFLKKAVGSKWTWISFDFDFSLGLFQAETATFNTGDPTPNALRRLLDVNYQFANNQYWSTLLFRKCMENAQFRADFTNRTADMMNTIFTANRLNQRVDQYTNLYKDELVKHTYRWGNPYPEVLQSNTDKMRLFANGRKANMLQHFDQYIQEVTGSAEATVAVSPQGGGTVKFSTISLASNSFPWTGTYFTGINIPVVATPAAGYRFVGWSDAALGTSNSVNVVLSGNKTLTAIFELITAGNPCDTDTQPPILANCPTNQTLTTAAGATCATANWTAPTATDNCTTPSVSSTYASGFCFPVGTTTVTYTATDAKNNTSTCAFTVQVSQPITSAVLCKKYAAQSTNNFCGCPQKLFAPYGITFDGACENPNFIVVDNMSFEQFNNNTATLKGTMRDQNWQLIQLDLTLSGGTYTAPAGAPVKAFCQTNQANQNWFYYTQMTGTYKVGASTPLSISLNGSPFQVGLGANQQVLTVQGVSAKIATSDNKTGWLNMTLTNEQIFNCGGSTNVCDADTQAPTLQNCPANQTLTTATTCANATWTVPTATDNCTVSPSLSSNYASSFCFPLGTTTVTYSATDAKNNVGTCAFNVTVNQAVNACADDFLPPTFQNCPANQTLSTATSCATATWATPTATDNCTASPVIASNIASGFCFPIGSYTITYTAKDAKNNTAFCNFNITVNQATTNNCTTDILPPTLQNCPVNQSLTTSTGCANATWSAPTATDNCTASPTLSSNLTSGFCFPIGTTAVTYVATDAKGNQAFCNFNVAVQAQTTGGGSGDLELNIGATPTNYSKFSTETVTITLKNNNSVAYTNVKVGFPFPSSTANGGRAVPSIGSFREFCFGLRCNEWVIPSIAAGATATLKVPIFIQDISTPIVFKADLLASNPTDITANNNTASVTVNFQGAAPVVALSRFKPTQNIPIVVQSIFPNPTDGELNVTLESLVEKVLTIEVYNAQGQRVDSHVKNVEKGTNMLQLDASELPQGFYYLMPVLDNALRNAPVKFMKF
jgi:uncharacterized repeat protein (TIGR02543 family)